MNHPYENHNEIEVKIIIEMDKKLENKSQHFYSETMEQKTNIHV